MPVNESLLPNYLLSINTAIQRHEQAIRNLTKIKTAFAKISLVDGTAKMDSDTGITFTQVRRNEIFDACEPAMRRLLDQPDNPQ